MPHAALERAWSANRPAFGGWVTIDAEAVVGAMGRVGYEFIGFDCQHGAIDETDAAAMIRRLGADAPATIVRVSENSMALIGRVLDAGADGVIVPLVNNAQEAARAVAACRYPPRGLRSFGPSKPGLPLTTAELEARVSCFVMIETAEGLENAEEICGTPGVDGIVVGPADLSISMGLDPMAAFSTDQIYRALATLKAACNRYRVVLGIFSSGGATAARWVEQGCELVIVGGDINAMSKALGEELALAKGGGSSARAAS